MLNEAGRASHSAGPVAGSVASFLFGGVVVVGLGVLLLGGKESVWDKLPWPTGQRGVTTRPKAKDVTAKHAPLMQLDFSPMETPVPPPRPGLADRRAGLSLNVRLDGIGCILSEGQRMTPDDLRAMLEVVSQSTDEQLAVVLTVDGRCPFEHFARVRDICVSAGAAVTWD